MDTPEFHDPSRRGSARETDAAAPLGRKVVPPEPAAPEPAPPPPPRQPAGPEHAGRGQTSRRPERGRRASQAAGKNRDAAGPKRDEGREPSRGGRSQERPRGGAGRNEERQRAGGRRAGRSPGAAGEPAGEMPMRPVRRPAPRRPELPDERPFIPRDAWRDLRATVPPAVLDDVVKAVGAAAEALADGDDVRATQLLEWAKSAAPRSSTVREALGVAHYAAGRYGQAHSELLTYRRLSGSQDQNHLLADCVRATGKPDKAAAYVEEMIAAKVDEERVVEGLLVLAGVRVDREDFETALQILHRAELDPDVVKPWHPRLWYAAGDILERLGRGAEARDYFEAILSFDDEFGDVDERLARLDVQS